MRLAIIGVVILGLFLLLFSRTDKDRPIIFMATTTTQDSGLLSILIPELEKDTGLDIQTIAFGTGKVLRSAMEGNADVILVHDPENEITFMENGFGTERIAVMRNNFIIVGPESDPAKIVTSDNAANAFTKIVRSQQNFVSRGDESGTHNAEQKIWSKLNVDPLTLPAENYIQTGAGMGRTLNVAIEKAAYVLTDSATWATYENKGDHQILFEGDDLLINTYHLITVNAESHPHVSPASQNLILDWFQSNKAYTTINQFKHQGQTLYFPIR